MKRPRINQEGRFRQARRLLIRAVIILTLIFFGLLFAWNYVSCFVKNSDYFKVKETFSSNNTNVAELSYLKGYNIFSINLEKESFYIAGHFPAYRKVRLLRILPNRIYVDFVKRNPEGIIKLYRYFYVDEEGVLFDTPQELEDANLPIVVGLETKIFGPRPGLKYNIKELAVALNIIKELKLNKFFKDYKIKKINVVALNNVSFFIAGVPKTPIYIQGQALGESEGLQIKLGADNIKSKITILATLLEQLNYDTNNINYIDLRFKEPVIKFNNAK